MKVSNKTSFALFLAIGCLFGLYSLSSGRAAVTLNHQEKTEESSDKPPFKTDTWTFATNAEPLIVDYTRYLNLSPSGEPVGASLPSTDFGVGFDGGVFANWYRGNVIRVLVDGVDIFAGQPAKTVEAKDGENGILQFTWDVNGSPLVLRLIIPPTGDAVYAMVDLSALNFAPSSIEVLLNAYPGGFAPAYHQASHRIVQTDKRNGEVPPDLADDVDKFPKLPLSAGDDWIFYSDKITDQGALGLLLLSDEKASGEIRMSSYAQITDLNYPNSTKIIHLGFYAFKMSNEEANATFLGSLASEREKLKSIPTK